MIDEIGGIILMFIYVSIFFYAIVFFATVFIVDKVTLINNHLEKSTTMTWEKPTQKDFNVTQRCELPSPCLGTNRDANKLVWKAV